jgi:hypothetical protein
MRVPAPTFAATMPPQRKGAPPQAAAPQAKPSRIHRSGPESDFAIIPNETLRDPRLSYRARGILAEVLSRPDDWITSADSTAARARRERDKPGEGREPMRAAFAELKAAGYLHSKRRRDSRGRIITELHWYDRPAHTAASNTDAMPGRPRKQDVSAGRTDDRFTERRFTGTPATGTLATGTLADGTSSRRPSTKTTSTDVAVLDAVSVIRKHTDADDGEISALLTRYQDKARNLAAYVTGLAQKGHLARDLQELRDSQKHADLGREIEQLRTGPACEHGTPGGIAPHPLTGEPLCPQCRHAGPRMAQLAPAQMND